MSNLIGHCGLLINTCPKYKQFAINQCILIRRYAKDLKWPVYLASSELTQEEIKQLKLLHILIIAQTPEENLDFVESRIHALKILEKKHEFVLLLQDDFMLDRDIDYASLSETILMMIYNRNIPCVRLMPCPRPTGPVFKEKWQLIDPEEECYFSFQAAIWSTSWVRRFFEAVIIKSEPLYKQYTEYTNYTRNQFWLYKNPCEREIGCEVAKELLAGGHFVGYPRAGNWSNAVYLSPWPYRPTAIEKGVVQEFAKELLQREGLPYKSE